MDIKITNISRIFSGLDTGTVITLTGTLVVHSSLTIGFVVQMIPAAISLLFIFTLVPTDKDFSVNPYQGTTQQGTYYFKVLLVH